MKQWHFSHFIPQLERIGRIVSHGLKCTVLSSFSSFRPRLLAFDRFPPINPLTQLLRRVKTWKKRRSVVVSSGGLVDQRVMYRSFRFLLLFCEDFSHEIAGFKSSCRISVGHGDSGTKIASTFMPQPISLAKKRNKSTLSWLAPGIRKPFGLHLVFDEQSSAKWARFCPFTVFFASRVINHSFIVKHWSILKGWRMDDDFRGRHVPISFFR